MITIVAAATPERIIGKENSIPWHIPEERQLFHAITNGQTVIMGRRTFESIGRPLPDRRNIVISSSLSPRPEILVAPSLENALEAAGRGNIYVIGGGQIYAQALSLADALQLSHLKSNYEGDVFFPEFKQTQWRIADKKEYEQFIHITYVKNHEHTPSNKRENGK